MARSIGGRVACIGGTLFLAFVGKAEATVELDQEQPTIVPLTELGGLSIGGNSEQILAQVITAGVSGFLHSVGVAVECSNSPDNNLIVEIRDVTTDDSGNVVPTSIVRTTEVIEAVDLPPFTDNFRIVEFVNRIRLSEGAQFAIVLRSEGQCGTARGPTGDPYMGGDAYFDARPNPPGEWVPLAVGDGRRDLPFQTYMVRTDIDHFKCYRVTARTGNVKRREVFLEDQFGSGLAVASGPVSICNPVGKDGEMVHDSDSLLVCYTLSRDQSDFKEQQRLVDNQFGEQELSVRRPEFLCVPSSEIEANGELDLESSGAP